MRTPTSLQVGAISLILTAEYFLAQLIAQLGWPGYSISQLDVSALGVTVCGPFTDPTTHVTISACSPLHAVMNIGFIALGILTIIGIYLTRSVWPKRKLSTVGRVFIMLGGLGEILAGAFPGNVNIPLHATGALLHWVIGGIGILLIGFALRKGSPRLAAFSFVCAALALIGFFLYGSQEYFGLGRGGMERLTAYPLTVWLIVVGITLLLRKRDVTVQAPA